MRHLHFMAIALMAVSAHAQDVAPDHGHTPQVGAYFQTTGSNYQIAVYPISDVTDAYPNAAKMAQKGGMTDLNCDWAEGGHITTCRIASLADNDGFADAAVALVTKDGHLYSPVKPGDNIKAGTGLGVTVKWIARPSPCAYADATLRSDLIECADFATFDTLMNMYPERAAADEMEGSASVDCTVADEAGHVACVVASEQPAGYGFGAMSVKLMGKYLTVRPKTPGMTITGVTFHDRLAYQLGGW